MLNVEGNNLALSISDKWRGLTPARARESAQVGTLTKFSPATAADAAEALGNLLAFTASQFNIGKNLDSFQAGMLADDMLERYWHWRFDEFAYVLKEAVGGRWGTTYDRIDAPTVHEWCRKYEAQRSEQIEHDAEERHRQARLDEAGRGELLPAEQMPELYFKAKLQAMTDEVIQQGIDFYEKHPEAEHAARKVELAREVLSDRAAWAAHEKTRPRSAAEDEEAMNKVRQAWLTQRAREREELEMKETGAELAE